jgi:hypothetical protein
MRIRADDDHPARDAATGVAGGRLGLQVIFFFVNDNRVAHDAGWPFDGQGVIGDFQMTLAVGVHFDIAKIAGVTLRIGRAGMLMLRPAGIEMPAGAEQFRIAQVRLLVNVNPVLARLEAADIDDNFHAAVHGGEHRHPLDGVVRVTRAVDVGHRALGAVGGDYRRIGRHGIHRRGLSRRRVFVVRASEAAGQQSH